MTIIQLTNILMTLISVVALSCVFFGLLPRYRVDVFRQNMFALRDELFDYAAAGNIAFNDPAYVLLRKIMNALIRYGHHITVFRLFATLVFRKSVPTDHNQSDWTTQWESALEKTKKDSVRTTLKSFHDRAMMLSVKHLVTGSIPLMGVIIVVCLSELMKYGVTNLRQSKRAACAKVLVGPMNPRSIEEEALCAST